MRFAHIFHADSMSVLSDVNQPSEQSGESLSPAQPVQPASLPQNQQKKQKPEAREWNDQVPITYVAGNSQVPGYAGSTDSTQFKITPSTANTGYATNKKTTMKSFVKILNQMLGIMENVLGSGHSGTTSSVATSWSGTGDNVAQIMAGGYPLPPPSQQQYGTCQQQVQQMQKMLQSMVNVMSHTAATKNNANVQSTGYINEQQSQGYQAQKGQGFLAQTDQAASLSYVSPTQSNNQQSQGYQSQKGQGYQQPESAGYASTSQLNNGLQGQSYQVASSDHVPSAQTNFVQQGQGYQTQNTGSHYTSAAQSNNGQQGQGYETRTSHINNAAIYPTSTGQSKIQPGQITSQTGWQTVQSSASSYVPPPNHSSSSSATSTNQVNSVYQTSAASSGNLRWSAEQGSSSQSYQTQPQQSQLQHNQQPQQSNNYQSQNPIKHGAAAVNPWSKTSSSASTHAAASTNFNNNQHSSTGEGDDKAVRLIISLK